MENNTNKVPRLLISFVADNSASMSDERLGELIAAFRAFSAEIASCDWLEWELITYDAFNPRVVKSFAREEIEPVFAGGFPLLGRGALFAADRLAQRVADLREAGEEVHRPWLFLLSDGFTADAVEESAVRLNEAEMRGDLIYLPFRFSGNPLCKKLSELDRMKHMVRILPDGVNGFFAFVKAMAEKRSALPVGEGLKFAKSDFEGWAEL